MELLNFPPIFVCLTLLLVTIAPELLKCVSWSKISNISNFCMDFDLETRRNGNTVLRYCR